MPKLNPKILQNARELRKNMTRCEKKLWAELRLRNIHGHRFRKQVPLGPYIVDFLCHELKLIIELDGGQHNEDDVAFYDQKRSAWLKEQGYLVQRFWNNEILLQFEDVLESIVRLCEKSSPLPNPPPQGGRGYGKKSS